MLICVLGILLYGKFGEKLLRLVLIRIRLVFACLSISELAPVVSLTVIGRNHFFLIDLLTPSILVQIFFHYFIVFSYELYLALSSGSNRCMLSSALESSTVNVQSYHWISL